MKHYQSSDNGLSKIKKLVPTKPRQKNVQIPLYNEEEDDYDDDCLERNYPTDNG
jgi:hypothetical protein